MTRLRHDPLTQSLHWIIALAVIVAYAIGLVREELPKGDFRAWLLGLHMSIGMLVIGLTVVRIAWRLATPAPAEVPMAPPVRLAAKAGHLALYVALLALPAVGLLAAWIKGRNVVLFDLVPLPSPLAVDKPFGERLEGIHELAGHATMILAGLHAAAAIGHQWILRDGTLGRMLPFVAGPRSSAAE